MGIRLGCADETAPYPRPGWLELTCDGDHGLFGPPMARFETRGQDGFIEQHARAMKAGWLERQAPGGRQFLCPECSGKPLT